MKLNPTYQIVMVFGGVIVLDTTVNEDGEMHGASVFGTIEQACAYIVTSGRRFESKPDLQDDIEHAMRSGQ